MRVIKAQRVARTAQNSRVIVPKLTKCLTDVEGSSAVLIHAPVAILLSVVECQRIE